MVFIIKAFITFIFVNKAFLPLTTAKLDNCVSNIFCSGKLLHYVQMSRIFNDSKYFVDMKLKYPQYQVEEDFNKLLNETNNKPDKRKLREFIKINFEPPGSGLEPWIPNDWSQNPRFINDISDSHLKKWAQDLNYLWKKFGRVLNEDIMKNSSLYSQIYVPYPFIVPGGRFREFYYWDSFWIIEGLLLSEMHNTVQKMLMNFLYLVETYGYIPNGGRLYLLERSQPPMLIPMMNLYWENGGDYTFLLDNMYLLEKEFNFWMKNRSIEISKDGISYKVFQYKVTTDKPRPESYYEDITNAQKFSNRSQVDYFSEIKSAAESGWDFSSRWFLNQDERRTNNLSDIHASHLAPICLNSIIGYNAKLLAKFFHIQNNVKKRDKYLAIAENINKTISRIFWDEETGMWFDYNIKSNQLQKEFYPSSLIPLWAETYGIERDPSYIAEKVLNYLKKIDITSFPGGIPTSLRNSSQQWDLPNGWAPLQYFVVMGLNKIGNLDERASMLSYSLAEKWVLNCYSIYLNFTPHLMYEKYDVTHIGIPGGGGEYSLQEGFGWTNGVAMKFLKLYGHQLKINHTYDFGAIFISFILVIASILAIVSYIRRMTFLKAKTSKALEIKDKTEAENFV